MLKCGNLVLGIRVVPSAVIVVREECGRRRSELRLREVWIGDFYFAVEILIFIN